jgi:hypothetical protein
MKTPINTRFKEFHREHPEVYKDLKHLALQAQLAGKRRIGMKFLFERLRWEMMVNPKYQHIDFELNNNFTSRYARMLMNEVPYLEGMFETRNLRRV